MWEETYYYLQNLSSHLLIRSTIWYQGSLTLEGTRSNIKPAIRSKLPCCLGAGPTITAEHLQHHGHGGGLFRWLYIPFALLRGPTLEWKRKYIGLQHDKTLDQLANTEISHRKGILWFFCWLQEVNKRINKLPRKPYSFVCGGVRGGHY